ncbi:hypothetical protein LTR91_025120 [Friedmanniomyces endolithicus]|uniref:Uncharacterized protein n=1 Tax=Friedmanniomyces endolithicus TaxID=329885 RepID=A0AAN6JWA1_9PEZI|nr:hypothetical protein LTR57_025238 [Friedmanniomyces endolithicus]KAK0951229.1 hypothetical protein LTR91_025120 [Friedmanniomyces endolithicus]KAK0951385.1 hypothetical protein LTS01_025276 [Friedmanniomyces endolithicus]KAK1021420.1 hypothetical protein LTS16_026521 [Friedmanniomyces endolithicus]
MLTLILGHLEQRVMCNREAQDLEKRVAQYASGGTSDVGHHHATKSVGRQAFAYVRACGCADTTTHIGTFSEAFTPPSVTMPAPTDAYSVLNPALSELFNLRDDSGALHCHRKIGGDEGSWSPGELAGYWNGNRASHYPTRLSEIQESEADVTRLGDSSSDTVIGKALLPTPPLTPLPSFTAANYENNPKSATREVGVMDICPTAAKAVSLVQPLSQNNAICRRRSLGGRQEAALLADYDQEVVSVLLWHPTPIADQNPTGPSEDSYQLERLCQPVTVTEMLCTVPLTECVGSARPNLGQTDRAQLDPRRSSNTDVVPVAELVYLTTESCSDALNARMLEDCAKIALSRLP